MRASPTATSPVAWPRPSSARRCSTDDPSRLALYEEQIQAAYGDYYKVARAFVRLISEPKVLQVCVGAGLRVPSVMRELLAIMANLMSNDANGAGRARLPRASPVLGNVIPEQAWDLILRRRVAHVDELNGLRRRRFVIRESSVFTRPSSNDSDFVETAHESAQGDLVVPVT